MSEQKKFQATWESLKTVGTPQWYLDGKFGIFIHWGPYCVPAFGNEWYPRNMYIPGTPEFEHHVKTYGPHNQFGYKDFIPMFKAEKFDAEEWAELFRRSGAKFVVPVAEHHDGFPMYDSALTRWNAAQMGPRQDIVGLLGDAVRRRDIVYGVSSHRAEHWFFMNGGRGYDSDVNDPEYADFYGPAQSYGNFEHHEEGWKSRDWEPRPDAEYLEDWLARCCELVDKYQPQLVWFDWWIEQIVFQPYVQRFAAYYYNRGLEWGKEVAINYKYTTFAEGSAILDIERGQLKEIRPFFWQNDTSISKNSWGFVHDQDYKETGDLVRDLIDVVSKNGALLLNIGPRPDGTIPEPEQQALLEIGRWLGQNGEAIYDTRPWVVYGEGPTEVPEGSFTDTKREPFTSQDIRFTQKPGALYATVLARPQGELAITSLGPGSTVPAEQIERISMLGCESDLAWKQDEAGLKIEVPAGYPGDHAFSFKISLKAA
jgi:alpha-L-fucosidase